jgi:hypothetical protein
MATANDLISFGKRYGFEVEQISVQEIKSFHCHRWQQKGNMPLKLA